MVSVDYSVIVQIINFILLVWLMNIVLYKPIRSILAQRKRNISAFEQGIRSSEESVIEKEEAFTSGIREARAKGLLIKDTLLDEASSEERRVIDEISKKAQANLAEVREKIAADASVVKESLQKEVDVFATQISEKILGRAF